MNRTDAALISFQNIARDNALAATFLETMCFLTDKAIPLEMMTLRHDDGSVASGTALALDEAIGTLKAYGFVTERPAEKGSYDVHRLVQLATRNWPRNQGTLAQRFESTVTGFRRVYPPVEEIKGCTQNIWTRYLPCLQKVLEFRDLGLDLAYIYELTYRAAKSNRILWGAQVALNYYQQAATGFESIYGLECRATLHAISGHVHHLIAMSEWVRALDVCERVHPPFSKVFGPFSSEIILVTLRYSNIL
ncbi:hypothetical protein QBC38DRAFT_157665 [Podospora fimiseda]|uniref:Uncharacterized protein n=1 Tax=Podospora fimiseda TaxID=252190 RepID=A0AAN6YKD8_9PEZI|nr:hypothetical protein QBC38DRAFT_157665 [Podospora fimiseda]